MSFYRKNYQRGIGVIAILGAVLILVIGAWVVRNYLVKADMKDAVATLEAKRRQWDDLLAVASKTSRIALAGPVSQMQAMRRDVEMIKVPKCLDPAKEHLQQSMNGVTQAFLAFMGKDEEGSAGLIENAAKEMAEYGDGVKRCATLAGVVN